MYYHRGIDILLDSISKVILKIPNIQSDIIRRWTGNGKIERNFTKKKIS